MTGVSGGSAALRALIQGVQRASMTVTVRGGVVRGTVRNALSQPVAGVQLTINSVVTATTDGSGAYFAEGVAGPSVSVKALDPVSRQRGFAAASMNRPNGFANVDVSLIPAGAVLGDVKTATGDPAGAGVKVELFAANDLSAPLSLTFTSDSSQFEFPLVPQGSYVVHATSTDGHRGRSTVSIGADGDEATVSIPFLGEGSVTGRVLDGAGTAIPRAPVTFSSVSVFGATPPTNTNADADGAFVFNRVFIGTFTVQAHDDVTGKAGTSTGHDRAERTGGHGGRAPLDVRQRSRRRASGPTASRSPSALSSRLAATRRSRTISASTTCAFLPLGPFTVTVNDAGTRQQGRATGTLTTQGETRTVDVTLHAQGSVLVTVTDAGGNPVAGAAVVVSASGGGFVDTLTGTTGAGRNGADRTRPRRQRQSRRLCRAACTGRRRRR